MRTTPAGQQWPSELTITKDPVSGATVRQLTSYRAHSNHSYFTYPCWYDDGNAQQPYLLSWRFCNGVFEGRKVLAWHRGSFHSQQLHVHPAVHANGTQVLYTADPQAYGQVFIVDVPEWDALPDRAAVTKNKEV